MVIDALILAGGRSTRLEGSGKQKLLVSGVSLLERTVQAVRGVGARGIVLVSDETMAEVTTVREDPAYAGPVAAIAAGLAARPTTSDADILLVLACDMPGVAAALPPLIDAFAGDGVVAVDRGVRQQLVLALSPAALAHAVASLDTVVDAPVRALLAHLDLTDTHVPDGSTDDIDTWDDAARFGVARPAALETHGARHDG